MYFRRLSCKVVRRSRSADRMQYDFIGHLWEVQTVCHQRDTAHRHHSEDDTTCCCCCCCCYHRSWRNAGSRLSRVTSSRSIHASPQKTLQRNSVATSTSCVSAEHQAVDVVGGYWQVRVLEVPVRRRAHRQLREGRYTAENCQHHRQVDVNSPVRPATWSWTAPALAHSWTARQSQSVHAFTATFTAIRTSWMRLFGEIGGVTLEGAGSNLSGRGCQDISKNILSAWKLLLCDGLCMCS